ncbi:MAG: amidase [Acetobacteraceae bacterium SCN 69-10]|nr:amidase [Rhodospirillales bacterium]ODU57567.1 MAG: amidase [Acetobacteraceae bacterium SCN 69-10]OJY63988.1 MAG: amidase [Rhodospirillales bacterium 70-18]
MPATADLWRRDAAELAALIRTRQVSAREAVQAVLGRMDAVNPAINAVVRPLHREALAAADAADAAQARGEALGVLHGVPVTTKVNTDQAGLPTDNGVVAYKDVIAAEDNPVIAHLRRAGAIVVGRTNTPAYSMRWFTANDLHGRTLNPWDARLTPGGSSGGAAAAVAAGIGPIGHGNDIGGSIRYPAYCCGVAGLKPTHGRVPAWNPTAPGPRPIASQLMSVNGPLARRVRDLRLALEAMAGAHPLDPRSLDMPLRHPAPGRPPRVALVAHWPGAAVHPAVAAGLRAAGAALAAAGYVVEEIDPPDLADAAALWMQIAMPDLMTGLAPLAEANGDAGIKRSMELWRAINPPPDPARALAGLARRELILQKWQVFLQDRPLVLMPISAALPYPQDHDLRDAETAARMTVEQGPMLALAVLGLPCVAVPAGLHEGVPLGVQIVAGRFREDLALDAAEVVEAALGLDTPIDPRGAP